ncbi:hypothetical protein RE428_29240 [Marinobacter nanhaiticus D15-8W]|uniref:DUF1289 domain-containing protein n=1 Tax=Marinobacter nanhaiticus D15-8W TaxID=626887 RepID=N6WZV9_9GAMM|nr:DUF1289 domain-containing protein [Marinobacter nanhaiticus]ENO17096.1 DUF1289 domain-containing protein [Marinobacter nanhaiticus D15-8W]BES71906.1 hypothetical protein RE428_29240 [Marinobacter nanhaiticus D15-8W]
MSRSGAVRSPCVSVCALDENDICIGCQRTADEITRWSQMSDEERLQVMKLVIQREDEIAL